MKSEIVFSRRPVTSVITLVFASLAGELLLPAEVVEKDLRP